MEFKVRDANDDSDNVEKSIAEKETEHQEKHEEETREANGEPEPENDGVPKIDYRTVKPEEDDKEEEDSKEKPEDIKVETPEDIKVELTDDDVLSHMRRKIGNDEWTFEDANRTVEEPKEERQLSTEVEAYLKFNEETGRTMSDYMKLNRDLDSMSDDAKIAEYMLSKNPALDNEDVKFMMDERYSFDADLDEDTDIRRKKIAKKEMLGEATSHLKTEAEKYKAPLESSEGFISAEEREQLAAYKESTKTNLERSESTKQQQTHFSEKTNELFSNNFEGFDFKSGEDKFTFKVKDAEAVKKSQMDPNNFIAKHLDEKGLLKSAEGWHKALHVANDPDAFFNWAYELGQSKALESDAKKSKNIDMDTNKKHTVRTGNGLKVKAVSSSNKNGSGLKITRRK